MRGPPSVRRVIVGTAGHIDHGKTTLVERLTGVRTDRLPEEQARGMTIDVGYAAFSLPDGTEVGLIDVPGHERLVHTMVAGATSIDVALLVVAADDGPMPQTREHVDILDLLRIPRGVVALTKIDVAGPERAAVAAAEVRELLAGTSLAQAPLVPVSSVTGEGLDALRAALAAAVAPADAGNEPAFAFRMPVLRAFVVPGRGTVVTGIPAAGRVEPGAALELLPAGRRCRLRGLQVHHRAADAAGAGQRTALLLSDVELAEAGRGMVVASAGGLAPTHRAAARLRLLRRLRAPVPHARRLRLHVGSAEAAVRLHLLASDELAPGAVAAVELESDEALCVAPGDRFVLRTENESETVGGGVIVGPLSERLRRGEPGSCEALLAEAERLDDPAVRLEGALSRAGLQGRSAEALAAATGLLPEPAARLLEALAAQGRAELRRQRWFLATTYRTLRARVLEALRGLHAADPALAWHPVNDLRAALRRVPPETFDLALDDLERGGEVRADPARGVAWKGHAPDVGGAEERRVAAVLSALTAGAGAPPDEAALTAAAGTSVPLLRRALSLLEARGQAVRLGPLWFAAAWVADARARLQELGRGGRAITVSEACAAWGTSRRFGIPLLEAFDRQGLTRRAGAARLLR